MALPDSLPPQFGHEWMGIGHGCWEFWAWMECFIFLFLKNQPELPGILKLSGSLQSERRLIQTDSRMKKILFLLSALPFALLAQTGNPIDSLQKIVVQKRAIQDQLGEA
ncbi:MAG: hypothetical protein H7246_12850, partial [Phycisphaerae bacterium]|nr:hypothetical protein [Saprospiraceae bacterium]